MLVTINTIALESSLLCNYTKIKSVKKWLQMEHNAPLKVVCPITSLHQTHQLDVLGNCSKKKIHTSTDHSKSNIILNIVNTKITKINFSTENPKILPDILHAIGNTPLVKLNHIPQAEGIKCEMCKLR